MNSTGRVLDRKDLRRDAFAAYLVQLPAGTVVAMEACSGAHYWGRRCAELGLQPRLMAAQFVKPFRMSARNKNDRNDAEAIATAARQGNMRSGTPRNSRTADSYQPGSGWCQPSIPAAGIPDSVASVVGVMPIYAPC